MTNNKPRKAGQGKAGNAPWMPKDDSSEPSDHFNLGKAGDQQKPDDIGLVREYPADVEITDVDDSDIWNAEIPPRENTDDEEFRECVGCGLPITSGFYCEACQARGFYEPDNGDDQEGDD